MSKLRGEISSNFCDLLRKPQQKKNEIEIERLFPSFTTQIL